MVSGAYFLKVDLLGEVSGEVGCDFGEVERLRVNDLRLLAGKTIERWGRTGQHSQVSTDTKIYLASEKSIVCQVSGMKCLAGVVQMMRMMI